MKYSCKSFMNRLMSLFKGKGVSILEKGRFFGSGNLENYSEIFGLIVITYTLFF